MAKLDRPLYGDYATGTLGRALCFRRTENPPDAPGDTAVYWGTVAKIPVNSCRPSPAQVVQRENYAAAVAAWRALSDEDRATWNTSKPANLSGFNFFLRLYLLPALAYFGYIVFGEAWFQLAPGPDQPAAADYDSPFPASIDEFPAVLDGAHSPQAWMMNRAFSAMLSIENYLILHASSIEGG
ncbi:hypothetical protein D4R52_01630 [bacterium]|nr:MAG: hypothetical protein D4R52_01630 [bacterium]